MILPPFTLLFLSSEAAKRFLVVLGVIVIGRRPTIRFDSSHPEEATHTFEKKAKEQ